GGFVLEGDEPERDAGPADGGGGGERVGAAAGDEGDGALGIEVLRQECGGHARVMPDSPQAGKEKQRRRCASATDSEAIGKRRNESPEKKPGTTALRCRNEIQLGCPTSDPGPTSAQKKAAS